MQFLQSKIKPDFPSFLTFFSYFHSAARPLLSPDVSRKTLDVASSVCLQQCFSVLLLVLVLQSFMLSSFRQERTRSKKHWCTVISGTSSDGSSILIRLNTTVFTASFRERRVKWSLWKLGEWNQLLFTAADVFFWFPSTNPEPPASF